MKSTSFLVILGLLLVAGCGGSEDPVDDSRGEPSAPPITTESGLVWTVLEPGDGPKPRADQGVSVHVKLIGPEGVIIDTEAKGQPLSGAISVLKLGRTAMPFLQEAPLLMKIGDTVRLTVPPELGSGSRPLHGSIPAGSATTWELTLLAIHDIPPFSKSDPEKIITTESGLMYEVLAEGEGASPTALQTVSAHYTGWLEDGTLFDSSHGRGEPTPFPLNRVIAGWTEGVQLMKPGASYKFTIPADLAYGSKSPPGSSIPPNSTLIFLIELEKVVR